MNRKVVSFSIDENTFKKLKELCAETERQVSWIIKKAILSYFDTAKKMAAMENKYSLISSETSLKKDWLKKEEDEAWQNL